MSTSSQSIYYLLWKGQQSGPFSLDAIREKLGSGQVNRMHQINHRGNWMMLGEFLDAAEREAEAAQREAEKLRQEAEKERRRMEDQRRQVEEQRRRMEAEQTRREYEAQLAQERAQQTALKERLAEVSRGMPLSPASGVPMPPEFPPPEPYPSAYPSGGLYPPIPPIPTRTSGLAIAAFILSFGNLIPFVNYVVWILVIIFGHVALSNIKRDSTLKGRGLALAALIITYTLLGLGFIVGFVAVSLGRSFRL